MKTELVKGGGLLLAGTLLLSGCVGSTVKPESLVNESAQVNLDNKTASVNKSSKMQLFIYQDDDAANVSKKATESRKGYVVEFALNKPLGAEQPPAKIQYLD